MFTTAATTWLKHNTALIRIKHEQTR